MQRLKCGMIWENPDMLRSMHIYCMRLPGMGIVWEVIWGGRKREKALHWGTGTMLASCEGRRGPEQRAQTKEQAFTVFPHARKGSSRTPTFTALLHSLDFPPPSQRRGI